MEASTSRLLTALTRSVTSSASRTHQRQPRCQLCRSPLILQQNASSAGRAGFITAAGRRYASSAVKEAAMSASKAAPSSISDEVRVMASIRPEHELYNLSGRTRRLILNNADTADKMVKAMDLTGSEKFTVIDMYAGKGLLSRSLLQHPNVERVIAIEPHDIHFAALQTLIESSAGRLQHIALDPFWWDTYSIIRKKGLLDSVRKADWATQTTNLVLTGCIPDNVNGQRLITQQLMCTIDQAWLYDIGRFSSYFLVPIKFAEKIKARPGSKQRHKLSVMFDACVDLSEALPSTAFTPTGKHIDQKKHARQGPALTFIKASPKVLEKPMTQDEMDVLEYMARNMFVHRSTPWSKSLKFLAAGAEIIVQKIKKNGDSVDPSKKPGELDVDDWYALVRGFLAWPFRPTDLDQSDVKDEVEAASGGTKDN